MAKKRGKKGKSKGKSRKSKARRRSFIKKISRDGKISKKDGKKAARKGISLRKIRNRNIGDYRQAKRDYERSGRPGSYKAPSGRPQFEPLKIKRGAEQADRRRSESKRSSRSAPKRSSRSSSRPSSPEYSPTPYPKGPEGLPDARTQEPSFKMPDFQGMMDEQYSSYQSELDSLRAEQIAAAEENRRQAEEKRRQFELAQRTMLGNEARAGQQASFQLGGEPGMRQGGVSGFKRRKQKRQVMKMIAGLAPGPMLNL